MQRVDAGQVSKCNIDARRTRPHPGRSFGIPLRTFVDPFDLQFGRH